MNDVPRREKATHAADLPHKFDGAAVTDECGLCFGEALDARHVAWERAAMAHPSRSRLTRELGS